MVWLALLTLTYNLKYMSIARRLFSMDGGGKRPFVFTIEISSTNTEFGLPINNNFGINPSIRVDWGDGSSLITISSKNSNNRIHTYTNPGTYTISIEGNLPYFRVDNDVYKELYKSVEDWGEVQFEFIDFYGCYNLDRLPTNSNNEAINHDGLHTVKNFNSTFRQTGIAFIPRGIFDYSTEATSFIDTFLFCFIQSIPAKLFYQNAKVTNFSGTFNGCVEITNIPSGLFDNNIEVKFFDSVFRNCRGILFIPNGLFTYNTKVISFANAFNMGSTSNVLVGTTPQDDNGNEIWERINPIPYGSNCFAFCINLTNYSSIPNNFK